MDMLTKLNNAMIKTGAVIRAVPKETTDIYETSHEAEYPTGKIFYNPQYGREMLHVTHKLALGGQFMIAFAPNNSAHLTFNASLTFPSIEDAAQFIIEQSEV